MSMDSHEMGDDPSRARAPVDADEQREAIGGMILRREWHPGASHKALAEEWGVSARTVSRRALEAMHAVRVGSKKPIEDFVAESLAELDSMQAMALAEEKVVCVGRDEETKALMYERVPQPNVRAGAYCLELKAKMLGAFAHEKRQDEPDPVATMSPEEKLEAHERAAAELRKEIAEGKGSNA